MNDRKVLNLKISYLKHRIKSLPRGWIGSYQGNKKVIITYDPNNSKVTYTSKRRYSLNTKKGVFYSTGVLERIKAEARLEKLKAEWKMNFIGEPETIEFPLRKYRFDWVNRQQFADAVPNQNTKYKNTTPIIYKDQTLRSKNELIAIQEIEKMGFEWKTEILIKVGIYVFCPDVVFYVPYIDKVIILELDGKMDKDDYRERAEERRKKYIKAGFVENRDVLFFRFNNEYDFDLEDFRQLINQAIERSAADIQLIHANIVI